MILFLGLLLIISVGFNGYCFGRMRRGDDEPIVFKHDENKIFPHNVEKHNH